MKKTPLEQIYKEFEKAVKTAEHTKFLLWLAAAKEPLMQQEQKFLESIKKDETPK
jgi:hypothetical protein